MIYNELLYLWICEKALEIRTSTKKNYEYTINNQISPYMGSDDIRSITKRKIQDFINNASKKYKYETVSNMSKVISQSFSWASENEYITDSPYKGIKIPKDKCIKEIKVFTVNEINLLLSSKVSQHKKDMILLSYRTGMRIGEILALKWEDINMEQDFLTVRRTLSNYINGKPEFAEPKTRSSRRRIDLDLITLNMLKNRKNLDSRDFVFCKKDGSVYSRQSMRLDKLCTFINIKPRSFHALRHTHASILLSHGVHPKIVQERLGHAKISMTLDTYSHLIPGMQRVVVDIFNNI
jgi:integrase